MFMKHPQIAPARISGLVTAAEAAARKWTFRPATRYGAPVRSSVVVPFRFTASE